MITVIPDTIAVLAVPFILRGNPAIPASNSVRWTLIGHDGLPVSGAIDQPVTTGPADTQAVIQVPGSKNQLGDASRLFESRRLIVSAILGGAPWSVELPYRVAPRPNISVTNGDVRAYLGVNEDELPDDGIDVFAAFVAVRAAAGATALTAALTEGGATQLLANRAVLAQTVLLLIPSLQQRLLLTHTDGSISATRNKIDFKAIAEQAQRDLASGLDAILGRTPVESPFFVIGTLTDVITGA